VHTAASLIEKSKPTDHVDMGIAHRDWE